MLPSLNVISNLHGWNGSHITNGMPPIALCYRQCFLRSGVHRTLHYSHYININLLMVTMENNIINIKTKCHKLRNDQHHGKVFSITLHLVNWLLYFKHSMVLYTHIPWNPLFCSKLNSFILRGCPYGKLPINCELTIVIVFLFNLSENVVQKP